MDKSGQIKRYVAHLGSIAFNYSMVGAILTVASLLIVILSWIFMAITSICAILYYIFLVMATFLSLFTLLASDEFRDLWKVNLFDKLSNATEWLGEATPKIMDALPIMALVTGIICLVSFVCLLFDRKWEKSKSRLITLVVIVVGLIVLSILVLAGIVSVTKGA